MKVFRMIIKFLTLSLMCLISLQVFAEAPCDVRPGVSVGVKVLEFATGNTVHSKMPMSETTPAAILEEMINLQDMGICKEKMISKKCVLKFEKRVKKKYLSLYRDSIRWTSWHLRSKELAQNFVKDLKRFGFCL
jgi:hypothetical protein